mgnify:FL=1
MGAPFEADFQLIEEQLAIKEKNGSLPYILTLDSDLLVLGDNIIRYEPKKFSNISVDTTFLLYTKKNMWGYMHKINKEKRGTDFVFNNVTWCLFACLIGNDYTKGATNMGFQKLLEKPKKKKKFSPMGEVADACKGDDGIDNAIQTAKNLIDDESKHDAFVQAVNVFLYAPVFRKKKVGDGPATRVALVSLELK